MSAVKVGAEDDLITYWLQVYLDHTRHVDVRAEAAAKLDELLRAPVWPS